MNVAPLTTDTINQSIKAFSCYGFAEHKGNVVFVENTLGEIEVTMTISSCLDAVPDKISRITITREKYYSVNQIVSDLNFADDLTEEEMNYLLFSQTKRFLES